MKKNKKKIFTVSLITVNVLLWGMISYKVIDYFLSIGEEESVIKIDDKEIIPVVKTRKSERDTMQVVYQKLERDPFTVLNRTIEKEKKSEPVKKVISVPVKSEKFHYKLNGIINNSGKKLVIIQDTKTGETVFLREGEKKDDLQIKKIYDSEVEVVYNKEKMKLVVEK